MAQDATGEYLRNTVMSATPQQLQLMLYDGAIRFARQARKALETRNWEGSCEKLIRAQRIVLELQRGLRHEVNPTLCDQLSSLYIFVYNRLIDANLNHSVSALDDALRVLEHQRETWLLVMEKMREPAGQDETRPDSPEAGVGESFSVEG